MKISCLIAVGIFIMFDVITGYIKAEYTKTISSSIMREGLFHKLSEILAVMFGYTCEYVFPVIGVDLYIPFSYAITCYIVIMETTSVIENLCVVNPKLRKVFEGGKHEKN